MICAVCHETATPQPAEHDHAWRCSYCGFAFTGPSPAEIEAYRQTWRESLALEAERAGERETAMIRSKLAYASQEQKRAEEKMREGGW